MLTVDIVDHNAVLPPLGARVTRYTWSVSPVPTVNSKTENRGAEVSHIMSNWQSNFFRSKGLRVQGHWGQKYEILFLAHVLAKMYRFT